MRVVALLLLGAAMGGSREYTDEDRAGFPKLFHLDEYDRCLARRDGLYCLGTFDLIPSKLPHPTYELMKAYSDESYRHFNRTRIHRGYCVSARCPIFTDDPLRSNEFNTSLRIDRDASHRFERCVDRYASARSFDASVHTFNYCRTHDDMITEKSLTTAERIFGQVITAVVLINIVGTIYDIYTKDGPRKNKLLSAFSIPANWRRLTAVHEAGDPRLTALLPMQGLRVIALAFTTYAHACVLHFSFYVINPEFLEQLTQRMDGVFFSNGTSLTQAFVMMACFLTAYNLLIYSQKQALGLHVLPICILKRLIRITPVYLLLIGFGASWWVHTRDGPLVSTTIGLESEVCKNKFWYHVFNINNIVDPKNSCILPTWFLAVDMHMFILACTLTLFMWRRRSAAAKLYTILLVASCVLTAVVAYINEYKSMIYLSTPEQIRNIFRDSRSIRELYMSSWGALASCFVGLLLAHIQFEVNERKIKLSGYKWFVCLHYVMFLLLFTWPLTGTFIRQQKSPLFRAAYMGLDRPIYCIFMAIFLLGVFNVDGPLRRFYSWRGWHPMARMSLTMMLLHWCVTISIGTRPTAYYTSTLDIFVDWIATHVITYVVAVPISILVEIPMQRFFDTLIFSAVFQSKDQTTLRQEPHKSSNKRPQIKPVAQAAQIPDACGPTGDTES